MRRIKAIFIFLVLCITLTAEINAYAATGNAEVFYFSDPGINGAYEIREYLSYIGYTAKLIANQTAPTVRSKMSSDAVFAIVCHGAPGRVYCYNKASSISAKTVSSDPINYSLQQAYGSNAFSSVKFLYFGGCNTAQTGSSYGNLLDYSTSTLGAKCSLGFIHEIINIHAKCFEENLFYYLYYGYSVTFAASTARSVTYSMYGSYGGVDSYLMFGTTSTIIK